MIELIESVIPTRFNLFIIFCRAGTDLSKCSDLYGISLI